MVQELEWVIRNNRLELQDSKGRVLEAEIIREGRCVHFDLSKRKKSLKNMIRQLIGLNPTYLPRVIATAYRNSQMGQDRKKVAQNIQNIDKQNADPIAKKTIKHNIVTTFRERYPRIRD